MKGEPVDQVVTDVVLARVSRPDFLARLGQQDGGVDAERQALLEEIDGHQQWLEQVHAEAERRRDLGYLTKQEDLVRPKLEAAQSKLEALAGVYPVILELAKSGRAKRIWAEHEEAGGHRLAWR